MHVVRILATSIAIAIAQNAGHFDYDAKAPLGLTEVGVEHRAAADVHDITYASPKGGRVPAYLVVPQGKGPFAAVLFGHGDNFSRGIDVDAFQAVAASGRPLLADAGSIDPLPKTTARLLKPLASSWRPQESPRSGGHDGSGTSYAVTG